MELKYKDIIFEIKDTSNLKPDVTGKMIYEYLSEDFIALQRTIESDAGTLNIEDKEGKIILKIDWRFA